MFAQAATTLVLARLALRTTSFWTVLRWLGMQKVTTETRRSPSDEHRAELIGWAVRAAAARLPWKSTCLMEALAGAALLRRHGLPGTLSLGIGKGIHPQQAGPDADPLSEKAILAHAWLNSGHLVLTGATERARYAELVSFALR
jgi:hypothetical protein